MNLFEVVSEKFKATNAATMIANYPVKFIKLLIKAIEKDIGKVRNKTEDPETKSYREPIFTKDGRGRLITRGFPGIGSSSGLGINIDPYKGGRQYSHYISLEIHKPFTLVISPTRDKLNITRMTVDEVINHIVNNIKSGKYDKTTTPTELNIKSLEKLFDRLGLKVENQYAPVGETSEYDYMIYIRSKTNKDLTIDEVIDIYMMIPKIFKWHDIHGVVLVDRGVTTDYFWLHSAIATETNYSNKERYAALAKNKSWYIERIFEMAKG